MSRLLLGLVGLFLILQYSYAGYQKKNPRKPGPRTKVTLKSVLENEHKKRTAIIDFKSVAKHTDKKTKGRLEKHAAWYAGAVQVGHSLTIDIGIGQFGADPGDGLIGSCQLSAPPEITLVSDGCSSHDNHYGECDYIVTITPTATAYGTVTLYCPTYYTDDNNVVQPGWPVTHDVSWQGFEPKPPIDCEECEVGSIIGVDGQTVMESVPIIGTDFSLVYSSRYAAQYMSPHRKWRSINFRPNGMTVSAHHNYDKVKKILYRGDGISQSDVNYVTSGIYTVVADQSGSEVYIFDTNGVHISTKYGLTGTNKYLFYYDASGLREIEDSFGNVTYFNRDLSGNLSDIEAPRGQETTITLDPVTLLITDITNPMGKTHSFTYKVDTELVETFIKPEGQVTTFEYDELGKLIKDTGNGGNSWDLISNPLLTTQPIEKKSAMARSTYYTVEYDIFGNYARNKTDPSGLVTTTYQATNRAVETISSIEESFETRASDPRFGANVQRLTSHETVYGSNVKTTTFGRTVSGSGYFTFNSITDTATTSGRVNTKVYTASTKTAVTTSDEGATTTKIIDTYERPTSFKIGSDTATTYTYDMLGRLSVVDQGGYNTLTYAYNANGNVQSITNARSEVTSFTYDNAGNMLTKTLPGSLTTSYSYDDNGNVESITPPSKPAHTFSLNTKELLDTYTPPALVGITPIATTYTYNLDKQLTSISRPDGQTANYNYDATTGLLNSITWGANSNTYTYLTNSPLISSIQSWGDNKIVYTYYGPKIESEEYRKNSTNFLFAKLTYGFDTDHRRTTRALRGNSASPTSTITTVYNDDDMPVEIGDMDLAYSYPSGRLSTTTLDNISDTRTYDARGFLATYTAKYTPTNTTLYTYTLTRDSMSRISGKTETVLGVTDTFVYTYDTAGRLTAVTKNGSAYSSYTYDNNGNRTSGTHAGAAFTSTFDDQDRMLSYNSATYNYNKNGDLTSINYVPSGTKSFTYDIFGNLANSTLTSGTVISFRYDGRHRRIARYTNGVIGSRFMYENDFRIAASLNDSGVIAKEYVYGTHVSAPDYMLFSSLKYFIIKDHLGSPRLVVKSTDGTVAQRLDYTDLGKVVTNTTPGFQPYGFAGGLYDPSPNLVKFGARDYDAETGRWLTKDPIRFEGGDSNLYGYVVNDPINFIDPNGLQAMTPKAAAEELFWDELPGQVDYWMRVRPCEQEAEKAREEEARRAKYPPNNTPVTPVLPPPFENVPITDVPVCTGGACG